MADKAYKCPVCESQSLDTYDQYEICKVCWWEDCGYQRDNPDEWGGPNTASLNQAREHWKKHGRRMTKKEINEIRAYWAKVENETQK